uniref:Uncharacterized protein n=1 Tax=Haemonchus contortus TaxID=6289 RepID=A0A7I4Y2B2_HAECO
MDRYSDGRTRTDSTHRWACTDRHGQTEGYERTDKEVDRHVQRGPTRTDEDPHPQERSMHKQGQHTHGQTGQDDTVDRSLRPSALPITRPWATIAHTDLKWTKLL